MKATSYDFEIDMNPDLCDDPSPAELEYIAPFLPQIIAEMNRTLSDNED